jgi:hypothetical protein
MIVKIFSLAICIGAVVAASPARPPTLRDLTVAPDQLPSGCALSPAPSVRLDGNTVRSGLWAGLPANPWIGTDPVRIASIHEVLAPLMMPEGPPLTPREATRVRLHLADGIVEAYEAVYLPAETSGALIRVFALQFPSDDQAAAFWTRSRRSNRPATALVIGPIVTWVSDGNGACFRAIAAHLQALSR